MKNLWIRWFLYLPGNYTISVRDSKGCKAPIETITVDKLDKPTYKIEAINPKCSGDSGNISVIQIDSKGYKLSYSINDGKNFQSETSFKNLPAGIYTLTVRYVLLDGENELLHCEEKSDLITLEEKVAITASIVVTEDISCDPKKGAKVKVTNVAGGKAPYSYNINNTRFKSEKESYIPAGTTNAPIVVQDSNGCIFNMTTTIGVPPPAPVITSEYEYFCNGEATVTVHTTIPDYNYNYALEAQDGKIIGPNRLMYLKTFFLKL